MQRVSLLALALLVAACSCLCPAPARGIFASQGGRGTFNIQPGAQDPSAPPNVKYDVWHDQRRNRDVPVKIYRPTSGSAPYPVVIFSHGLGGSREAAVYLGDFWSQHGYFCVFLQHAGSDMAVWKSAANKNQFMQKMKTAANGTNLIDRVGDVEFAIDQLVKLNQTSLNGQLNLHEIAVAGHSFGAGTTLAVAGQRLATGQTLGDKRVKAAIYLCPPVMGRGDPHDVYGGIKIPGLLLTGTEDNSPIGGTSAEQRRIPFDGMLAPHQYLVNFKGADHATFGGRSFRKPVQTDAEFHRMIDKVTLEFLNASLKDDPSAWQWLDSQESTAYFGKVAQYERK